MPGWHEATAELQQDGKVQMVGIIQEQHPDRCRLFMQWKQMDWPILVDSLNLFEVSAVPLTFAIDEHGVIRQDRLKLDQAENIEAEFLSRQFDAPPPEAETAGTVPDLDQLRAWTGQDTPEAWRRYANAVFLWGGPERIDEAIDAYRKALELDPDHGPTHFRLGVAWRNRYDFGDGRPADFRAAVESWKRALDIDPNQYIWRRRIQQYGPRLDKPYSFYDWVNTARKEIAERGETPVELTVEPGGAEFAYPAETFTTSPNAAEPDPRGRIHRDERGFVDVEAIVVPPALEPGGSGRVHLTFRPNTSIEAHWNNEAGDMQVWIEPAEGWQVSQRLLTVENPPELVSTEPRKVEFEIQLPEDAGRGIADLEGYALYYVCEDVRGTCLYRRQDITVPVRIERDIAVRMRYWIERNDPAELATARH